MKINSKKGPLLYPLNRDISKKWFIEYIGEDGKKKKLYGKMHTFDTLSARLSEAEKLLSSLKPGMILEKIQGDELVRDLWDMYELRKEGWKPKSASAYKTHLISFINWYTVNNFPEMDGIEALRYLKTILIKNSNTTRNMYRANLKSLFADLKRFHKNKYPQNPFEEVRKLRECRKTKEWFRPNQVKGIMQVWLVSRNTLFCG